MNKPAGSVGGKSWTGMFQQPGARTKEHAAARATTAEQDATRAGMAIIVMGEVLHTLHYTVLQKVLREVNYGRSKDSLFLVITLRVG